MDNDFFRDNGTLPNKLDWDKIKSRTKPFGKSTTVALSLIPEDHEKSFFNKAWNRELQVNFGGDERGLYYEYGIVDVIKGFVDRVEKQYYDTVNDLALKHMPDDLFYELALKVEAEKRRRYS